MRRYVSASKLAPRVEGYQLYILVALYIRFRSPLLTESHLISFPPSTKMLQFLGYLNLTLPAISARNTMQRYALVLLYTHYNSTADELPTCRK